MSPGFCEKDGKTDKFKNTKTKASLKNRPLCRLLFNPSIVIEGRVCWGQALSRVSRNNLFDIMSIRNIRSHGRWVPNIPTDNLHWKNNIWDNKEISMLPINRVLRDFPHLLLPVLYLSDEFEGQRQGHGVWNLSRIRQLSK